MSDHWNADDVLSLIRLLTYHKLDASKEIRHTTGDVQYNDKRPRRCSLRVQVPR